MCRKATLLAALLFALVSVAMNPRPSGAQSVCQIQGIRPVHVDENHVRVQVQYFIAPSHPKPCLIGAYVPSRANMSSAFGMRPAGVPEGVRKGQQPFRDDVYFELFHVGTKPKSTETIEVVIYDGDGNLCTSVVTLRRAWGNFQYTFLGDYPRDREPGWSDECQGVTHDGSNWYVAQCKNWGQVLYLRIPSRFASPVNMGPATHTFLTPFLPCKGS